MRQFRVLAISLCMACVLAAGTAAAAQASSTPVTTAIKAQDKIIKSSPAYKSLKHLKLTTTAAAKKLIKEFSVLRTDIEHAATVVSKASASGAKQKQGQTDWVGGVGELGTGMGMVDTALQDAIDGRSAAAKSVLVKAEKKLTAANALGTKGDRLLRISTND